jgi:hypothetical protein
MTPTAHRANLLNAAILIACSLWAFFTLEKTSYTSLIPSGFGVALLLCAPALGAGRLWAMIVAGLLTLAILGALYVPLSSALEEPFSVGLLRVGLMMGSSALALLCLGALLVARVSGRAG